MHKTDYCGDLRASDEGRDVVLAGWVHRRRDHGGLIFVDLRDSRGLIQVVFHPETGGAELLGRAAQLGSEDVIAVRGLVTKRPADSVNIALDTGHVEMDVRELKVLARSAPLPFQVNEDQHLASEDLRLKYRFLDLRRPEIASIMYLRHRVMQVARQYFSGEGFMEVETPLLVKPTPEGARYGTLLAARMLAAPQPVKVALPGEALVPDLPRAAEAYAARYEGLAQEHAAQRALDAEAARWIGLAQAYRAAMKDVQAANAYAARYEALAQTFAQPTGYEPQRALNAYAARWSGLAQMLATAEP